MGFEVGERDVLLRYVARRLVRAAGLGYMDWICLTCVVSLAGYGGLS